VKKGEFMAEYQLPSFPRDEEVPSSSKVGLANFLRRQLDEDHVDLRSPWAEELDLEDELDVVLDFATKGVPVELKLEEAEQRELAGPYSWRDSYDDRLDGILEYSHFGGSNVRQADHNSAVEHLERMYPGNLRTTTMSTSLKALPTTTQRGLPFWSNSVEDDDDYLKLAEELEPPFPYVLGWRGAPRSRTETSQRALFMAPRHSAIQEGVFILPAQQSAAATGNPLFAAWGPLVNVDSAMKQALKIAETKGLSINSMDFSGFDKRVDPILRHFAVDFLGSRFKLSQRDRALLELAHQNADMGLLGPRGYLDLGACMQSGGRGTNYYDGLIHNYAMYVVASRLNVRIEFLSTLGDDGISIFNPEVPIDELGDVLSSELGFSVNQSKTITSKSKLHFLQLLYTKELTRCRSLVRVANGMLRRERRPGAGWTNFMHSVRAISQLMNAEFHPNFEQLVRWYRPKDKLLDKYSVAEIFNASGPVSKTESILGIAGFEHGRARLAGLPNSKTAQLLDSL
jgi:hypothetical protein